jgi:hypothetical protein
LVLHPDWYFFECTQAKAHTDRHGQPSDISSPTWAGISGCGKDALAAAHKELNSDCNNKTGKVATWTSE